MSDLISERPLHWMAIVSWSDCWSDNWPNLFLIDVSLFREEGSWSKNIPADLAPSSELEAQDLFFSDNSFLEWKAQPSLVDPGSKELLG